MFVYKANTTCDGDKESDGEDVEADAGNSSEDLRKVMENNICLHMTNLNGL